MGDGVKCVCNPTSSRDFRVPMTRRMKPTTKPVTSGVVKRFFGPPCGGPKQSRYWKKTPFRSCPTPGGNGLVCPAASDV